MPNPLLAPNFPPNPTQLDYNSAQHYYYARQQLNLARGLHNAAPSQPVGTAALGQLLAGVVHTPESDYEGTLSEDDIDMAESDDEQPDPRALMMSGSSHLLLPYTRSGTEVRTFSAFAQEQALSEYMNYAPNSELRNQAMRTIFMHFVRVTGPSMSLYERDPSPPEEPGHFEGNAELGHNLFSCKAVHPL